MERAAQFELTIDLKIAQELGLAISESLLMRADKVFPVSGVPLPESIRIMPPIVGSRRNSRPFPENGSAPGRGDRTGELIVVVEAIDPPQARLINAWGNGTVGAGTAIRGRSCQTGSVCAGNLSRARCRCSLPMAEP